MLMKLLNFFNTAAKNPDDIALEKAVLAVAKQFHLQVSENASVALSEALVNVDGLDRYAFLGSTKLGLTARVLSNTLRAEVLKQLPSSVRTTFNTRLSITAPIKSA